MRLKLKHVIKINELNHAVHTKINCSKIILEIILILLMILSLNYEFYNL